MTSAHVAGVRRALSAVGSGSLRLFAAWRGRPRSSWLTVAVIVVLIWIVIAPLGSILWNTLRRDEAFSLASLRKAFTSRGIGELLWNTSVFAVSTTIVAVLIGTVLGYLAARTNVRFKGLIFAGALVPLVTPGILFAIAWAYLASPKIGVLNAPTIALTGSPLFDVYSMGGMIFVQAVHVAPLSFLIMYAAFLGMDPSLEESAAMCGASRLTTIRRVTLPLVKPALYTSVLIMVIINLEAFEVPAVLGLPGGVQVVISRVWQALSTYPAQEDIAGAFSVVLIILTITLLYLYMRANKKLAGNATISGKAFRAKPLDLGKGRTLWGCLGLLYFAVGTLLPNAILLYASFQPYFRVPSIQNIMDGTLDAYRTLAASPNVARSFVNSIVLSVAAATVIAMGGAVIAWISQRSRARLRNVADAIAFIPLGVPGLVLGLGMMFVYLRFPIPLYGTLGILVIAYIARFIPYGVRYATASIVQISPELEEAAVMSGANWWQTFKRVFLPLMMPGLVAGWIYTNTVALRELSSSLLLYSPGSEVLSISIWEYWENGRFPEIAALGVLMMLTILALVFIVRRLTRSVGVREF